MKLTIKNIGLFAVNKIINDKITKINIEELLEKYTNHFKQESYNYQFPLLKTNTNLGYTNRFTKTIVNLRDMNEEQKLNYFKKIKKSIIGNNILTPKSCVQLCQLISHFPFQGDENKIIQKIRDYAQYNGTSFLPSLVHRFNLAYKYLMIQKATGSIKFKDFQIKKNNLTYLQNKFKNILMKSKITQHYLTDWNMKKTLKFEMKIQNLKRNIKINGLNIQSNETEIELISNRICDFAKKDQNIFIIKDYQPKSTISNEMLAKYLFKKIQISYELQQLNVKETNDFHSNLLKKVTNVVKHPHDKITVLKITNLHLLNNILSESSEISLKDLFGYLKFNIFHAEFQKLLVMLNIQNRKISKQLPEISNNIFQIEQKVQYKMFSPNQIYAQLIFRSIKEKQLKSINIYINQNNIQQFLFYFLKCQNQQPSKTLIDQSQNKNLSIVKNKLALASVIYDIPLNLNVLKEQMKSLRKSLYPLSYPYRFQTQSQ